MDDAYNEDLLSSLLLETVISHCETHRWRSLCVHHTGKYHGDVLDIDTPILQSLSLQESALEFFTSSGLHRSLLSINVPLLHADLPKLTPEARALIPFSAMMALRSLKAPVNEILTIQDLTTLQELEITETSASLPELASIPLPPILCIHQCTTQILECLNLANVQSMTIKQLCGQIRSPETIIPCPALKTLTVEKYGVASILYIFAPLLHSLCIGARDIDASIYRKAAGIDSVIALRDLPHHIKLDPGMIVSHLPLCEPTTLFLLEKWPQVEALSLRMARPFDISWLIAELLGRKKTRGIPVTSTTPWKYVPALKWLKLVVDELDDTRDRHVYARRILEGRRQSALACVCWIGKSGKTFVLNRDDL